MARTVSIGNQEFADILIKLLADESLRQSLIEGQLARSKEVNNIDNYKATLRKLYLDISSTKKDTR